MTAPKQEGTLHQLLEALIGRLDAQAGVLARVEAGLGQIGAAVEKAGG